MGGNITNKGLKMASRTNGMPFPDCPAIQIGTSFATT